MMEFLDKTWFVWWIFASLVILRWFHISSTQALEAEPDPEDMETCRSRPLSSP